MSRELISSDKFPTKPHNCKSSQATSSTSYGNRLTESRFYPIFVRSLTRTGPAVKVPGLVFLAGQTATGEIKQATRTALQNIKEVLELSGSSLEKVVKYNVYLADMKDFAAMNEVYIDFLPQPMPSRSCLQALPPGPGTVIEIECIAQA